MEDSAEKGGSGPINAAADKQRVREVRRKMRGMGLPVPGGGLPINRNLNHQPTPKPMEAIAERNEDSREKSGNGSTGRSRMPPPTLEDELSNLAYLYSLAGPPPDSLLPVASEEEQAVRPTSKQAREAFEHLIAAFYRLRVPYDVIEDFRAKYGPPHIRRPLGARRAFMPPVYRRDAESPQQWKARAVKQFENFCDRQIEEWQTWDCATVMDKDGSPTDVLLDPREARPKPHRGPGQTGRNATPEERYEWATLALFGWSWKRIALRYQPSKPYENYATTVQKAVTEILRITGLEGVRLLILHAKKAARLK